VQPGVNLREATFADYHQIVALEASQNLRARSRDEWSGLWLENPFYREFEAAWPIGWVLENEAGRIVGTIGNIPIPYVFRGRKLLVAAGRAWAVEERYRSVALMLMDTYFSQPNVDVFLNTTVNALAAEAFGVFGSRPVPAGDWSGASYWVTSYTGFARAALTVKRVPMPALLCAAVGACLYLKDQVAAKRIPAATPGIEVQRATRFCGQFDEFWNKLATQRSLFLGVRTREMLEWHFGAALRRDDAWLFIISDAGNLLAYAIFQRRDDPNTRLRRIRLVDFQALADSDDYLLTILGAALKLARQTGIHVVEKVGLDVAGTRPIDVHAPYRRKLGAWPFYYHAPDPELNAALESRDAWQPGSFDGDASL
jgi:hypothetical protein